MSARRAAALLAVLAAGAAGISGAADTVPAPYALLDIVPGAARESLARTLDLRDINSALAAMPARGRPDLGARGYGCMARNDEYADETCVSHEEKFAGVPTREIRLQFLGGRLQQASLSAEAGYYDAIAAALRRRYGAPVNVPAAAGEGPSLEWRNGVSTLRALRGPSLVFVSAELSTYAGEVVRKRARTGPGECH